MTSCLISSDCTIEREGAEDITRICYEEMFGTEQTFFCNCSGVFGFVGDECNEQSVQSIYMGIFSLISTIISFIGIILCLWLLKQSADFVCNICGAKKTKKQKAQQVLLLLTIMLLVDFCFDFSKTVTDVYMFANPDEVILIEITALVLSNNKDNKFEIISSPAGYYQVLQTPLSFLFNAYITLTILFSWLSVVQEVSSVFNEIHARKIKNMKRFSAILFFVLTIATLVSSIFLVMALIGGFLFILTIFMFLQIIYSRWLFVSFMKQYGGSGGKSKETLMIINLFSRWFIIAYGIYFLLTVIHATVFARIMLKIPPGQFNYAGIVLDAAKFGKCFLQFPTLLYIKRVQENLSMKQTKRTSFYNNIQPRPRKSTV